MNERLTTDDLRGMLPSEIVERFDDLRARLAASEAALAAERERNAPLRARIKEIQDRADQHQKRLDAKFWENYHRLFRPLNEALATERKLASSEADRAALVAAVAPVVEAWRGSNDVFPVLEILERVKVLADTFAEQPEALAPGTEGQG